MRYLLAVLAAAALAGCSGDDKGAAPPASTAAQTVTVTEPSLDRDDRRAGAGSRRLARRCRRARPPVGRQRAHPDLRRRARRGLGNRARPARDHPHEQPRRRGHDTSHGRLQRRRAQAADGRDGDRDRARRRISPSSASRRPTSFHSRLARSSALRLGDAVFAVGFPLGLGATVTSGIISGLHRTIDGENGKLTGLLQTDAAINPGNSGGPLVDRSGRLLGVNTAGVRLAEAENVSFAIAIDEALPVIAKIRQAPPESDVWLGIAYSSVDSESAAVQLGLDGTRARRRCHGRLSRRARREGGSGGRRRRHRRRRPYRSTRPPTSAR